MFMDHVVWVLGMELANDQSWRVSAQRLRSAPNPTSAIRVSAGLSHQLPFGAVRGTEGKVAFRFAVIQ